jgi:hypothetical protein
MHAGASVGAHVASPGADVAPALACFRTAQRRSRAAHPKFLLDGNESCRIELGELGSQREPPQSVHKLQHSTPHLHQARARPSHICTRTWHASAS